jgi:hypothetical protein
MKFGDNYSETIMRFGDNYEIRRQLIISETTIDLGDNYGDNNSYAETLILAVRLACLIRPAPPPP